MCSRRRIARSMRLRRSSGRSPAASFSSRMVVTFLPVASVTSGTACPDALVAQRQADLAGRVALFGQFDDARFDGVLVNVAPLRGFVCRRLVRVDEPRRRVCIRAIVAGWNRTDRRRVPRVVSPTTGALPQSQAQTGRVRFAAVLDSHRVVHARRVKPFRLGSELTATRRRRRSDSRSASQYYN